MLESLLFLPVHPVVESRKIENCKTLGSSRFATMVIVYRNIFLLSSEWRHF